MTEQPSAMREEEPRAILVRVRDQIAALCQCGDSLLEGQYQFLLQRVEALLAVTET